MIELTDEQASVLKQGYPVRVFVPELDGDIVVVKAAQRESTESVLQETLDEIRERAALGWLNVGLDTENGLSRICCAFERGVCLSAL